MGQKGGKSGGRQNSREAIEENEVKQAHRDVEGAFAFGGWG